MFSVNDRMQSQFLLSIASVTSIAIPLNGSHVIQAILTVLPFGSLTLELPAIEFATSDILRGIRGPSRGNKFPHSADDTGLSLRWHAHTAQNLHNKITPDGTYVLANKKSKGE
jgi:hypothetical protein